MAYPSRRALLRAGIAAAGLAGLPLPVPAAAGMLLTRHDAASPDGQAMLRIYAAAVARMMTLPDGEPLSWTFQWYVHAMRNDGRAARPPADTTQQALAAALWDTCEAHFDPRRLDFFPPWHRLFLSRFERIVRRVAGEPRFTMPYWNYTEPAGRALPAEFRRPGDPVWGALYRADRNPGINDGEPIDRRGEAPVDLAAMMSPVFSDTGVGDAGFCANLDNAPHAAVHVDVGTRRRGMGAVAWAANDPIFWLHHCTIDRIWASWNRAGGRNPVAATFLAEPFAFIDESGTPVRSAAVDAMGTASLGYTYDGYLERPAGSLPFADGAPPRFIEHAAVRAPLPIGLGAAPVAISLLASPAQPDFAVALHAAAERGRAFVLRLGEVRIARQPGVSYQLHLAPEAGMAAGPAHLAYIGTINVFGAIARGGDALRASGFNAFPRAYSFVVTQSIRRLLQAGRLAVPPQVILTPTGIPAADAVPTIVEIALLSA